MGSIFLYLVIKIILELRFLLYYKPTQFLKYNAIDFKILLGSYFRGVSGVDPVACKTIT